MAAKFKRSGLHRLECPMCSCYGYFTVAMLEDVGLPECFRKGCGETMQPAKIELAMMLGADDAPIMHEYEAKVQSVAKGQAPHYAKGRELESPEFRALYGNPKDRKREPGLIAIQRSNARQRRIMALMPAPEPMAF
jgi:hypothetical protein